MKKILAIMILILSIALIITIILTLGFVEQELFKFIDEDELVTQKIILIDEDDYDILPKTEEIIIEIYEVDTPDDSSITLTRYFGYKKPAVIFIHGMGTNHKIFDWDEDHSLARYLAYQNFDVWLLDLRTHDGDGDFLFSKDSDREYINKKWDFDNTLLKIDVVTAVDFVKTKTEVDKIFLSGHSYGGYLAYAYSELIGEEDLYGIITTASSPYANPEEFQPSRIEMYKYGFHLGKKAYVRPLFGHRFSSMSKRDADLYVKFFERNIENNIEIANALFYHDTTSYDIQRSVAYHSDAEPAGVWVDMYFGKNPKKYNGHWVDPQTLYDYSENLDKITVPILFIAGDEDLQDPSKDIYKAYIRVSSVNKTFYSFQNHSHMDILLGDNSDILIFPIIADWMDSIINNNKL